LARLFHLLFLKIKERSSEKVKKPKKRKLVSQLNPVQHGTKAGIRRPGHQGAGDQEIRTSDRDFLFSLVARYPDVHFLIA
jgi:hypothetical protein